MTAEMWRDLFAILGIGTFAAVGGHGLAWVVRRAKEKTRGKATR